MNSGGKQQSPFMANTADKVSQILIRNADKNFVQRIMKPDLYPMLDMSYEKDGKTYNAAGTHYMASGEVDGKGIVYPNIIQLPDGNLKMLSDEDARKHALQSKEFIQFDSPEEAEWFGKNYKSVWGQ